MSVSTSSTEARLNNLYEGLGDLKNDFRNKNLVHLIASYVEGGSMLDIGCGSGNLLSELSKKGIQTAGVEPSHDLVERARQRTPEANIVEGGVESVSLLGGMSFGTITMIDVLEHIDDDVTALRSLKTSLVDNGLLLIVVPAHPHLYGRRDQQHGHFRRYSYQALTQALEEAGFVVERVRFWNAIGYAPYFFAEKILHKELRVRMRDDIAQGAAGRIMNRLLDIWFYYFENRVNVRFGLSLICWARKS